MVADLFRNFFFCMNVLGKATNGKKEEEKNSITKEQDLQLLQKVYTHIYIYKLHENIAGSLRFLNFGVPYTVAVLMLTDNSVLCKCCLACVSEIVVVILQSIPWQFIVVLSRRQSAMAAKR